jgi:hypothetical protein
MRIILNTKVAKGNLGWTAETVVEFDGKQWWVFTGHSVAGYVATTLTECNVSIHGIELHWDAEREKPVIHKVSRLTKKAVEGFHRGVLDALTLVNMVPTL